MILGVDKSASESDIKKAYECLAWSFKAWLEASSPVFCRPSCQAQHSKKASWSRSLVCVRLHQKFLHDLGSWQECQRERHQEGLRMLGLKLQGLARSFKPSVLQAFLSSSAFEKSLLKSILGLCPAAPKISTWSWELTRVPARATSRRPTNAWLEASSPVFCRPSCQAQHSKKASWSRSLVCVRLHQKFLHDLGSWQECQRERHQEGLRMLGLKLQGLARSFKPSVLQAFLSSSAFEKSLLKSILGLCPAAPKFLHDLGSWQECQRERHQEGLRMLGLKLQAQCSAGLLDESRQGRCAKEIQWDQPRKYWKIQQEKSPFFWLTKKTKRRKPKSKGKETKRAEKHSLRRKRRKVRGRRDGKVHNAQSTLRSHHSPADRRDSESFAAWNSRRGTSRRWDARN